MTGPLLKACGLVPTAAPADCAGLNLILEGGQIFTLIGSEQAACTAWLRALGAVDRPRAGSLELAGVNCAALTPQAWRQLRCRVGYVVPGAPLLSVVSGLANVVLAANYHRRGDMKTLTAKAYALLERLGWEGPLDVLPAYLDAHQRHVLSIARTLMLEPRLLFVNEPFQMSVASQWEALSRMLVALAREEGLGLVIGTNHLRFVRQHADRVLCVESGEARVYDDWQELTLATDPENHAFITEQTRSS